FALSLMLGGLRGPLVMYLWTSSESQKSERELDSFDTQIELIRLLQPEFASVHLFQMWNLAYNISVQMTSLAGKYSCILGAIDYGRRTNQGDLPNNVNIIYQIGSLYGDKLGGSTEKAYFLRRVRTETLPVYRVTMPAGSVDAFDKAAQQVYQGAGPLAPTPPRVVRESNGTATTTVELAQGDQIKAAMGAGASAVTFNAVPRQSLRTAQRSSGRPTEHDTLLDADGRLLPAYLAATTPLAPGQEGNNGAELQYLEQYQPFPYGLPPQALSYNYYKRSQVFQTVGKQRHLQISEMVLDRQPAIGLKFWAEEEWLRARRLEAEATMAQADVEAGRRRYKDATAPEDPKRASAYGLITAGLKADAKVLKPDALAAAIFSYERSARVAADGIAEYQRHLVHFTSNFQNYQSHMDHLRAIGAAAAADAKFLRALQASGADRAKLLAEARAFYEDAEKWSALTTLKYYVEDVDAKAAGFDRAAIGRMSLPELRTALGRTLAHLRVKYPKPEFMPSGDDQVEYVNTAARAAERVKTIGG
ncbi:MAG: hypothetical protein ACAI43_17805, partial [Phycisphaerae bacterium]